MQEAANVLEELNIPFESQSSPAHRTPDRMYEYAKKAVGNGLQVIIAGAGGSAHLPGMTASLTPLLLRRTDQNKKYGRLDSLLSLSRCPRNSCCDCGSQRAKNAGLLASKKSSAQPTKLYKNKLEEYQKDLENSVLEKVEKLDEEGFKKYLEEKNKK